MTIADIRVAIARLRDGTISISDFLVATKTIAAATQPTQLEQAELIWSIALLLVDYRCGQLSTLEFRDKILALAPDLN